MPLPILSKFEKGECEKCDKPATRVTTRFMQPSWVHIYCDEHADPYDMDLGPYQKDMLPNQLYA